MKVAVSRCPSNKIEFFTKFYIPKIEVLLKKYMNKQMVLLLTLKISPTTTTQVLANILSVFVRDKENKEGVRTIEEWNDGNVVGQGRTYPRRRPSLVLLPATWQ